MSALPYVEDVAPQIAASGALRKPFDLDELLGRVRLALAGRAGADRAGRRPGAQQPLPGISAVASG